MRIVTMDHLKRLEDAVAAVGAICSRGSKDADSARVEVEGLAHDGDGDRALTVGAKAIARAHVQFAEAGSRLEIAAVAFLGLPRFASESVLDYTARIHASCTDLQTILAIQRANQIIFRP